MNALTYKHNYPGIPVLLEVITNYTTEHLPGGSLSTPQVKIQR